MKKVQVPALPLEGGCQCGALRYTITGRPSVFYLCHCTECQRHTSSAFGQSLRFLAEDVALEGDRRTFSRIAESGRNRFGHFCPKCGVRVLHGSDGSPEVNIKAGTLDDTSWLIPAGHIWTRSAQPFMTFGSDELVYDVQPPDKYEALKERWRKMTGDE